MYIVSHHLDSAQCDVVSPAVCGFSVPMRSQSWSICHNEHLQVTDSGAQFSSVGISGLWTNNQMEQHFSKSIIF